MGYYGDGIVTSLYLSAVPDFHLLRLALYRRFQSSRIDSNREMTRFLIAAWIRINSGPRVGGGYLPQCLHNQKWRDWIARGQQYPRTQSNITIHFWHPPLDAPKSGFPTELWNIFQCSPAEMFYYFIENRTISSNTIMYFYWFIGIGLKLGSAHNSGFPRNLSQ